MSGWGKKDKKTAQGTLSIVSNGTVTGSSTLFTTQAAVGDFVSVNLVGGGATANAIVEWVITAIASNTSMTVAPANTGMAATYTAAYADFVSFGGQTFTVSEKPLYLTYGDSTDVKTTDVYGVDNTEIAVSANGDPAQVGWVHQRTVKTGQIAAVDNVGAADGDRKSGIYLVAGTSSGSGTGHLFRITVSAAGAASIEIVQQGAGHADNDTITVADSLLGNGGAADLTFQVNGVSSKKRWETLVAIADSSAASMSDAEDAVFADS